MTGIGQDQAVDDGFAVAEPGFVGAREWLLRVLERPGYAFTDAQVLENLRAVYALAATVEAVKLAFVQELASRPQTVVGGPLGRGRETVPHRGPARVFGSGQPGPGGGEGDPGRCRGAARDGGGAGRG